MVEKDSACPTLLPKEWKFHRMRSICIGDGRYSNFRLPRQTWIISSRGAKRKQGLMPYLHHRTYQHDNHTVTSWTISQITLRLTSSHVDHSCCRITLASFSQNLSPSITRYHVTLRNYRRQWDISMLVKVPSSGLSITSGLWPQKSSVVVVRAFWQQPKIEHE